MWSRWSELLIKVVEGSSRHCSLLAVLSGKSCDNKQKQKQNASSEDLSHYPFPELSSSGRLENCSQIFFSCKARSCKVEEKLGLLYGKILTYLSRKRYVDYFLLNCLILFIWKLLKEKNWQRHFVIRKFLTLSIGKMNFQSMQLHIFIMLFSLVAQRFALEKVCGAFWRKKLYHRSMLPRLTGWNCNQSLPKKKRSQSYVMFVLQEPNQNSRARDW
ncbi:hypothetical protein RIF29_31462 [Crotalaria pallida]|uniref:Uncharacterized protein n=1 Tax=Crotalaria pallida TaxID=3830 RepID=A0AAN9EJM5_CROPI